LARRLDDDDFLLLDPEDVKVEVVGVEDAEVVGEVLAVGVVEVEAVEFEEVVEGLVELVEGDGVEDVEEVEFEGVEEVEEVEDDGSDVVELEVSAA